MHKILPILMIVLLIRYIFGVRVWFTWI